MNFFVTENTFCCSDPLQLEPPFPNDAEILKPKVGLEPNPITNWFERC